MIKISFPRLRDEDGIAIVVAILLLAMMLTMGLGTMAFVDGQSTRTAQQRQRETAFNISEAALNAQVTQISRHWSTSASTQFTTCSGTGGGYCPTGSELTALVPGADSNSGVTWTTNVYDDSGGLSSFFADSQVAGQCGCDANGNGKVWVRAQATVRNHTRAIVSLVQQQTQAESVPHAAIIAGALTIENNGQHSGPIIQSNGGIVAVRCHTQQGESQPCAGQPLGKAPTKTVSDWNDLLNNQISGFQSHIEGYTQAPVFTQDQIYRFISTATADSTYYTTCPSTLTGKVVVVNTTSSCSYTGNTTWNTTAAPGFLVFLNAASTLSLGGNTQYNGVIYHANMGTPPLLGSTPQSSGSLISTQGNTLINGGVIIEGAGGMDAGESGANIQFDDHGFDAVVSYAAAGIIQNSWREIQPGV